MFTEPSKHRTQIIHGREESHCMVTIVSSQPSLVNQYRDGNTVDDISPALPITRNIP